MTEKPRTLSSIAVWNITSAVTARNGSRMSTSSNSYNLSNQTEKLELLEMPAPFNNDPTNINLSKAITALSVLILIEVMFGLGCSVDFELLRKHLKKPIGIAVAGLTQFGLLPLIAFGLAKAVNLGPVPGIAILITASVPGGILSNVLAYLIKGDMSLSMLMTTASTILALGFIPLNLFIYGTRWLPTSTHFEALIPYSSILLSLALMIGPTLIGILFKWKLPKMAETIKTVCKVLLLVTIITMIVLASVLYGIKLICDMPNELWLIAAFLPAIGFSLGFILATLGGLRDASRRTVAIETGCQNSHLGAAILKVAFPSQMIGVYFMFPLIYGGIQFLEGSLLVILTLTYKKLSGNSESKIETATGKVEKTTGPEQQTSLGRWLADLQLKWLSRGDGNDKDNILQGNDVKSSISGGVVASVAHEIAETAVSKVDS